MLRILSLVLVVLALPAHAHEFWLSPNGYQIKKNQPLVAHIRVGEAFKGGTFSYLKRQTERFEIVLDGKRLAVTSRIGDRPALNQPIRGEGLAIVVHETKDSRLEYKEWAKFIKFVNHKDFDGALDAHLARGLPQEGFFESYRRFAKSLIAVGDGKGQDQPVGLRTEIVALKNPYTDDLSGGLPVQVLLNGQPRANVQVELFAKAPGSNGPGQVTLHRTNGQGVATLPVQPGTEYMADAVTLLPLDPANSNGAVWETLWANLTFQTGP